MDITKNHPALGGNEKTKRSVTELQENSYTVRRVFPCQLDRNFVTLFPPSFPVGKAIVAEVFPSGIPSPHTSGSLSKVRL